MASTASHRPQPLAGHFWTVASYLRDVAGNPRPPESVAFETSLTDPDSGVQTVTGRLHETGGDSLVVVLHGIAGCCESGYVRRAAAAAARAGLSSLRLNLRGSDGTGNDFFHAGLTDDLHAVLRSAALADYRSLHVFGYSLGGHVALRAATEDPDPRLASVAAVCSPLDLSSCAAAFDLPASRLYRRRILDQLVRSYARVAGEVGSPRLGEVELTPLERVRQVRGLREFDGLTVVRRFGFEDVEDYYRSMSVGPVLDRLRVPALLVAAISDPLVPISTLEPFVETPPPRLSVKLLERGGHVGFPTDTHLGQEAPVGVEPQVVEWLRKTCEMSLH